MPQLGDVLLYQSVDGGNIVIENGIVAMDKGLETSVYLSLFGGNEDDHGLVESNLQWWGNSGENNTNKIYRSKTQFLLQSIPATSNNLLRLNDAVNDDLNWMISAGVANSIEINVRITSPNNVLISIVIIANGEESEFEYSANWKESAK